MARPRDWPGANSVKALTEGRTLGGLWIDRTREREARSRGESFPPSKYATRETVQLEPIPCWIHFSKEQYRRRVAELVKQIESETAARHTQQETRPVGIKRVLSQKPHNQPERLKRAPAPGFHAASKVARRDLVEAYRWFIRAYREATRKLREGDMSAAFPPGSFPPRLSFVDANPNLAPG